jgi:hypothetical protein
MHLRIFLVVLPAVKAVVFLRIRTAPARKKPPKFRRIGNREEGA